MATIQPSSFLVRALQADALVSGAVAALQLIATDGLASLLKLPTPLLRESGLFLVAYVALLLVLASRPKLPSAWIGLVVLGNVGWALGCAALVAATSVVTPNALGIAFLAVQAIVVLVFARLEYIGLQRSPVLAQRAATA